MDLLTKKSRQTVGEGVSADHLSKAINVYENGLKAVPSARMFDLYTKLLMDAINKNGDGKESEPFSNYGQTLDPISHLLKIYEKAESTGCISEDLACQHITFLLQLGKVDETKMLVEKLCTNIFPDSVQLWSLRLSIELLPCFYPLFRRLRWEHQKKLQLFTGEHERHTQANCFTNYDGFVMNNTCILPFGFRFL